MDAPPKTVPVYRKKDGEVQKAIINETDAIEWIRNGWSQIDPTTPIEISTPAEPEADEKPEGSAKKKK